MKFINEAYDNGFLAGQNDIIENRILDEFPYPEINSNNPDLIIKQEDYGNYMVNNENYNEHNNENNQENNEDDSMDDDEEDMDQYKYLGVKNLRLNVNVSDPDIDPNTVHRCFNDIPEVDRDKLSISFSILPNLKPKENINDPDVRYTSMRQAVIDLERRIVKISPDDIQYYGPGTGIQEPNYRYIELNYPNLYIGFSKLMLYLENLYDARKLVNDVIYPPEYSLNNRNYKSGIIPYNNPVNNENNIIILPPQGYDYMDKVITSLNLREINLPYKVLELVYGQYYKYNYNISEVEEIEENEKYIPNTGIKNFDFNLRKIVADSRTVDSETHRLKLTESDKSGFDYYFNNVQRHMNPVIGFTDDILVIFENRNYYHEIDLTANNDKVRVHKLPRILPPEPVPENNSKRIKTTRGNEDPIESEYGITNYDVVKKVYNNYHLYTIEKENAYRDELDPGSENYSLGFKGVMQTTEIPIIDNVRLDEVRYNGLLTYSIDDFNDSYSLEAGSKNPYANDFIGFNQIQIPIKINNKVVPGFGSTPNIYRPSDFDPDAIGFSSFQIQGTSNSGGSGGDSSSGSVNNLQNYVFKGNTIHPYTIREYNNSQYPPTDYTGFDAIIVDTNNDLEVLDVNVNKLGKYSLAYGDVENIMPVMNANTTDDIILSGTPQWNSSNLTWFRLFDGNSTGENGFHSSSSISEGYLKIQFLNEKKSFNYFNCYAYSGFPGRAPTHIVVEGSDDDESYTELFNGNIAYVNLQSLQNVLINTGEYYYYKFTFSYSDGKSDYIEFTELQLMEYSTGGYKGVNVNVDLDNLMLSHSGTVENIESNTSNTYYPFDVLTSVIPVMNSYNSTGASIIDVVGSARNLERFFDGQMYGSWVYLDSDDVSFVLNLDNPIVPRSIFFTFYYGKNNSVGEIKIYGSNDNLDYVKIFEKTNVFDESYFLKYEDNYLYENIDNENSYSYLKFELKRNLTGNVTYTREIRIFDVDKYLGFDKFTIINNTYSKTSDPVATNLEPHNKRVYVNTDNGDIHPYVRRNWMTVPLEDKVIDYVGNYIPGNIDVSSGFYGIRSISFNKISDESFACTDLIPVQVDNSNCSNGHLIVGNYDIWMEIGRVVDTSNEIWWYFSDWNDLHDSYRWFGDKNDYFIIKNTYPFIMNEILVRQRYMDRDITIDVYGSKDGINYVPVVYKKYDSTYNVDNKRVMYFDNNDYYISYKVCILRYTGDWNFFYKIQFCYCNNVNINANLIYPNYQINVNQPGIYYYNKPEGWDGINNIILNVGNYENTVVNKVYTHNTVESILPPSGKTYINQVNVQVDVKSNVINRSSSIDVNDNRYKIELDVSGDQILEYKYLYKINNPSLKSINIYYRYFGDNSSNVNLLTNVNSVKYELFVQTEVDKTYIYCYNYVNNIKTYISKTEVNKSNLFVLGIENYNNNENLNNCSFIKEIEVGKNNDIITNNPINNNSNSVEIGVNNNPSSSSGVIVNTSSTTKGVNVYVRDRSNNDVSVASNVTGSFRVWVYRIPDDDDNVEVEVIDDNGNSYESHILPKSGVSKIVTSMYDSNDNFIGYETKVWNSYYSDVTFRTNTDDSVKEISEIPDYDNDFGGTGMTGLSDDALKSIVEDFNHRNDNFVDYMSVQRDQSNTGSNVNNFNEFLRDIYTPLMNGTNWNYSKLQAELTSRGISYSVSTNTITNGFPYGESGVREWAFGPGDFNNQAVVIGTITRIHIN